MFFHWSVFCFKSSPVKMSSMSLRRCSVHKTPALRKAMYAGVSSALPAGAPRSMVSNRGEILASPFWSSKSMAVSSGVRAVDINYLLCAQAVASHGVALAVTREERSAAMQETALAAVGQRCEPSTWTTNGEFKLFPAKHLTPLGKLRQQSCPWDRFGDHNTTHRRSY